VRTDIKFCGLTRAIDARHAAMCGARYAGVILAGGPRHLDPVAAGEVLDGAGGTLLRVGVFGRVEVGVIHAAVRDARLDIVQLHGDPSAREVRQVRERTGARVWAVMRIVGRAPEERLAELDGEADAVVFDTRVEGPLGGTGLAFDWAAAAQGARPSLSALVVAGGLTPENVAGAVAALTPAIVDVSSGVERQPGIKDHERMAAFADAVRAAGGGA
jgi:phosphoribosylanthranilate isomerase